MGALRAQRFPAWLFPSVPLRRISVLRSLTYAFVWVDLLWLRNWIWDKPQVPDGFFHPLLVLRSIGIGAPSAQIMWLIGAGILMFSALAFFRQLTPASGYAVAIFYLAWLLLGFSYGKVDHDRFALLVALFLLPSVPEGRGERAGGESEEARLFAGWAVRSVQLAVVSTYFLAAWAKFRFGGWDWANGDVLARAFSVRGSASADSVAGQAWALRPMQWGIVIFELLTPLALLRNRWGYSMLLAIPLFHIATFALIGIMFWPQLAMLAFFLPVEKLWPWGTSAGNVKRNLP